MAIPSLGELLTLADLSNLGEWLSTSPESANAELDSLEDGFLDGSIRLEDWLVGTAQMLLVLHAHAYADIIPPDQMNDDDRATLSNRLEFELARLHGFAVEMEELDGLATGNFTRRVQMYRNSPHGTEWIARERQAVSEGMRYERRVLQPNSQSCGDCLNFASVGWVEIGTLPAPSIDCQCLTGCNCTKEFALEIPQSANMANFGWVGDNGIGDRIRNMDKQTTLQANLEATEETEQGIALTGVALDNLVTANGTRYPAIELPAIAAFLIGQPMLIDHDYDNAGKKWGVVNDAWVEQAELDAYPREALHMIPELEGYYLIRVNIEPDMAHPFAQMVVRQVKDLEMPTSVSIATMTRQAACNNCTCDAMDYWSDQCTNWQSAEYFVMLDTYRAPELSAVTIGAVRRAAIVGAN